MSLLNAKQENNLIFNNISDHVTLVQLIDTYDNVNNAISITGCWIYN